MTPQAAQDADISQRMQDVVDMQVLDNAEVLRRFESIQKRLTVVEVEIVDNTTMTTKLRDELRDGIGKDLKEIVDIFAGLKGGIKVMGWIGAFAKWAAGIGAAFAALWAIAQNFKGFK